MVYATIHRLLQSAQLPAAVVDLDAFDANLNTVADIVCQAGSRHTLRVATKSLRVPALLERIAAYGRPYQGWMCYSAQEARFLSKLGFDDLLVAYPSCQPSDLAALREVHERGHTIHQVVDSRADLEAISHAMTGLSTPFSTILEVDMSVRPLHGALHLGVRRSPVRSLEEVLAFYDQARTVPNLVVNGVMAYEAQVAGLGDRNPFKPWLNPVVRALRRASVGQVAKRRRAIRRALIQRGHRCQLFNGGGTGSLNYTVREPWLTEGTVGSGFLCPHLFSYYSNIQPEPACVFALQVVRSSDNGYVTCQGGGYVASGEPGWDKVPVPVYPEGLELVSTEGCGEVQTPLRVPDTVALHAGDPVLFRHAKGGELAERFQEYWLCQGGEMVGRVPTYRGLGQCFG